jgi:hypothetical protein
VLAAKHVNDGERLGNYEDDPRSIEKVEWSRASHVNADSPHAAIAAIEAHNAQNLRKHRVSRWEHIIVSFPGGERPDFAEMTAIEDRLMAAIGFGDHPRISAVHSNTRDALSGGYRHLHIAVSRIDPTTLKAEHPRHNRFALQAEAARLEIDLGLRLEHKRLLARERREIAARIALDRPHNRDQPTDGGEMPTPNAEQRTTIEFTREELRVLVQEASLSMHPGVSERIFDKLARATDEVVGAPPSLGVAVELTRSELFKIMLDHTVGSDDAKPLRADLQAGIAKKLELGEDRILASELHEISAERAARSSAKDRSGVGLQSASRQKATPAQALQARYKTEKAIALGARKAAEQDVYDRFSTYHSELRGFYDLRREQEKLNARQPHRVDRQNAHQLLHAQARGDRVEANQLRSRQLAAARRENPLPTWDAFLAREAERGDGEAKRLLREHEKQRENQRQHER